MKNHGLSGKKLGLFACRCDRELEELLQWGGSGVDLHGQNNAGSLYRLRRKVPFRELGLGTYVEPSLLLVESIVL